MSVINTRLPRPRHADPEDEALIALLRGPAAILKKYRKGLLPLNWPRPHRRGFSRSANTSEIKRSSTILRPVRRSLTWLQGERRTTASLPRIADASWTRRSTRNGHRTRAGLRASKDRLLAISATTQPTYCRRDLKPFAHYLAPVALLGGLGACQSYVLRMFTMHSDEVSCGTSDPRFDGHERLRSAWRLVCKQKAPQHLCCRPFSHFKGHLGKHHS